MVEIERNFYVGRVTNETEKAIYIGEWLPRSQITVVKRQGPIILIIAQQWLYDDKGFEPLHEETANKAFDVATQWVAIEEKNGEERAKLSSASSSSLVIPHPSDVGYLPFQIAGIEYIEKTGGKCLVADQMGMGKTIQALGYLNLHPELRPAIIVTPASVKYNWEEEARKWLVTDDKIVVIDNGKDAFDTDADIYIVNYALLFKLVGLKLDGVGNVVETEATRLFQEISLKNLILDESHRIKNHKSQRTKAIKHLTKQFGDATLLALTGTPILSRPIELWTTLQLICPETFNNWKTFVERYCAGHRTKFGWDVGGASNTQKLHELLKKTCMVRRLKKDVLSELPDKCVSIIVLNKQGASEARDQLILRYDILDGLKAREPKALVEFEKLRQEAIKLKMKEAIRFCENALENEDKIVIFAHHKFVIKELKKKFPMSATITGETGAKERLLEVKRFQEDADCKVFIGSITAAGEGITLTAASTVIFMEIALTPALMEQATDRLHRISQKNAVNSYWLVQDSSIEVYIARMLREKEKIFDAVLDGKVEENAGINMFFNLIETLKKEFSPCING